jgi:hypothetical protein
MSVSIQLGFTVNFGHNHITSFCADSVTAYSCHVASMHLSIHRIVHIERF